MFELFSKIERGEKCWKVEKTKKRTQPNVERKINSKKKLCVICFEDKEYSVRIKRKKYYLIN